MYVFFYNYKEQTKQLMHFAKEVSLTESSNFKTI